MEDLITEETLLDQNKNNREGDEEYLRKLNEMIEDMKERERAPEYAKKVREILDEMKEMEREVSNIDRTIQRIKRDLVYLRWMIREELDNNNKEVKEKICI